MFLSGIFGLLCVFAVQAVSAAIEPEGELQPKEDIVVLGAETFAEREQAGRQLWERGEESRNLLTALSLSDDPEQAWRARRLLRWVDLEMTPETPQEIVDLVESYLIAPTAKEREALYTQLLAKEAYVQLFRLPKHLNDEVVARSLADRVAELAGQVAREKILEGKDLEALAILEDAKEARTGHLRWVSLVSALGMRDELWGEMSSDDRMRLARWEGDVDLLRTLAPEDHEVWMTLNLIAGDPLPFLEKQAVRKDQFGMRARLSRALWEGRENEEEALTLLASMRSAIEENGARQSKDVLVLLAQLGFAEEVLPDFEELLPVQMFEYYHSTERLEEAFQCLGLEVGQPVPREWVDDALDLIKEEFSLSNKGCEKLLSLAQFFVERGRQEEANELFEALYEKVDELGVSDVVSYLAYLSGRDSDKFLFGYPEFAVRKAEAREEEVFSPEGFLSEAFFAEDSVFLLYRFLSERDEEMEPWQRVRAVFAVYDREVDFPQEEVLEILADLEKSARENSSEGEWAVLQDVGMIRGNMKLVEQTLKETRKFLNDDDYVSANLVAFLFADGRFEESVVILEEMLEEDPGRTDLMEYLVVALEASGKSEEAQEWLTLLEKLALGDGSWMATIGRLWGEVGDWERQQEYLQRVFFLFPSQTRGWEQHLYHVARSARQAGLWDQAAACQEAYINTRSFDWDEGPKFDFVFRGMLDVARVMAAFEKGEEKRGDELLARFTEYCGHESFFADDVFPVLRRAGRHEQVEQIWDKISPSYREALLLFPDGHNAYNTAAWVASRAACDLDDAMVWVNRALAGKPRSSAYLDTKAEVYFAQGNREEALKWSEKACAASDGQRFPKAVQTLSMLRLQYRHFRDDPFPLEGRAEN